MGKLVSKVTDMAGLTNVEQMEQEKKRYDEQKQQMLAQAQLDNDQSAENIAEVNAGGAAQASAAEITGAQKARRRASVSNSLGI